MTPPDEIDLTPEEAAELLRSDGVQLIDVREPYEVASGRLAGARHIEMSRLSAEAPTIDREAPVLFYCRVGARSGLAAAAFRQAGYPAYSLGGGLVAWHERGLPLEPADGTVADH